MNANDTNGTRLSVSGMRRYAGCGYAYKLYRDGAPRRISASTWYGGLRPPYHPARLCGRRAHRRA